jgi:hypothetical protein
MFARLLAIIIFYAGYQLYEDGKIREASYNQPLKQMSANARELMQQMLDAAMAEPGFQPDMLPRIQTEILTLLSQGAVAQRNHEMQVVRGEISKIGYLLSWFLKQKGLGYEQIYAKYAKAFTRNERALHLAIIDSASRANPSVFDKLTSKLWGLFFSSASESSSSSSSSSSGPPPGSGSGGSSGFVQARL